MIPLRADAIHFAIAWGINVFAVSPYSGLALAESRLVKRWPANAARSCWRPNPAVMDRFDFSGKRVAASTDMDDILVPVVEKHRIGRVNASPFAHGTDGLDRERRVR